MPPSANARKSRVCQHKSTFSQVMLKKGLLKRTESGFVETLGYKKWQRRMGWRVGMRKPRQWFGLALESEQLAQRTI